MAQRLKRLPTMWETRVRSLGQEDPLENEMATHSSTLAWKIPWMEGLGRLESDPAERLHSLSTDRKGGGQKATYRQYMLVGDVVDTRSTEKCGG